MADQTATLLRELPSVDRLLKHSGCERLLTRYNREYITAQCRAVLDNIRNEVRRGAAVDCSEAAVLARVENTIFIDSQPGHKPVVNATGTILHTNLGRALLPRAAIDAILAVADRPINLALASVQETHHARLAIESFKWEFFADSVAAMNLDRHVRSFKGHLHGPFFG